jgi:hypothetical protein
MVTPPDPTILSHGNRRTWCLGSKEKVHDHSPANSATKRPTPKGIRSFVRPGQVQSKLSGPLFANVIGVQETGISEDGGEGVGERWTRARQGKTGPLQVLGSILDLYLAW